MRLALYQPDIPPNTGTMLRLAACLGVVVDIIEPCGFPFSMRALRRSGMDYLDKVRITHHLSWHDFLKGIEDTAPSSRIILLTTRATKNYTELIYRKNDILLMGQEGSGVPAHVHDRADERVVIPMVAGVRSLNVAVSAAMVLGEALRQTGHFPGQLPG